MEEKIIKIKEELVLELSKVTKEAEVLNVKALYVGKKSEIQGLLASLKDMSVQDKKKYGSVINNTKKEMEELISIKLESLQNKVNVSFDDTTDYNLKSGSLHPVTIVAHEVTDILKRMGFTVVSGQICHCHGIHDDLICPNRHMPFHQGMKASIGIRFILKTHLDIVVQLLIVSKC